MPTGDKCWVDYAEKLRKRMFQEHVFEIEVPIEEVKQESGTTSSLSDLRSPSYWRPVRDAKKDWDTLPRNGVEVDFNEDDNGQVHALIFRLDGTWRGVLERALQRGQ